MISVNSLNSSSLSLKDGKRYFYLFKLLVLKDLRVRYRGSFLGYLWSMMNPLLYMLVLTFVFSKIMRFEVENLAIFILAGILTWNFFSQALSLGTASILNNGALLKKIKVPAIILTAASTGSVLVNFLLALLPFLIVAIYSDISISWTVLLLPFYLIPLAVFTLGLGLGLASLNVRFRDIGHVMEPLLQVLFYGTPIIYPLSALPDKIRPLLWLNPLTSFVSAMRNILIDGVVPSPLIHAIMISSAFISIAIGIFIYIKTNKSFVYYV